MSRGFAIAAYSAMGLIVVGVILIGWPGAMIFQAATPLLTWWFAENPLEHIHPDDLWPMVFYISILWPLGIVAGYLIARRVPPVLAYSVRVGAFALVLVGWMLALAFLFYCSQRVP